MKACAICTIYADRHPAEHRIVTPVPRRPWQSQWIGLSILWDWQVQYASIRVGDWAHENSLCTLWYSRHVYNSSRIHSGILEKNCQFKHVISSLGQWWCKGNSKSYQALHVNEQSHWRRSISSVAEPPECTNWRAQYQSGIETFSLREKNYRITFLSDEILKMNTLYQWTNKINNHQLYYTLVNI